MNRKIYIHSLFHKLFVCFFFSILFFMKLNILSTAYMFYANVQDFEGDRNCNLTKKLKKKKTMVFEYKRNACINQK